jgi:hypothetical protein
MKLVLSRVRGRLRISDKHYIVAKAQDIDFSFLSEAELDIIGLIDVDRFISKYSFDYGDLSHQAEQQMRTILCHFILLHRPKGKFTLDDIEAAFDAGQAYAIGGSKDFEQTHPNKDEYIKPLKEKSWDIEVEMEYDLESLDSSKQVMKPKLTPEGKIKITKIL